MKYKDILEEKDYGHQMRLKKGDIPAFYQSGPNHDAIVRERQKWLRQDPETYMAMRPEGVALLAETIELARDLKIFPHTGRSSTCIMDDPMRDCQDLGEYWESDYLLMKPDEEGVFRLVGGCLCFPSHWAIQDKLNRSMRDIHGPVPGLNDAIGHQIDTFLHRIKPNVSWERANWGLARTPEMNLHPSREVPRLDPSVTIEEVWWRLEEQSLVALPETGGILFGIKVSTVPLSAIQDTPAARQGLIRALKTMPESMAVYKGIDSCRERLIELLEIGTSGAECRPT